jgi:RNA polymerase sigma-70 factor, ECF subfamily
VGKESFHSLSDEDLVKEFLAEKDNAVFEEIYGRYNKAIYNYIRKLLFYQADPVVEDLVNEVFIKAYTGLSRLRDSTKFKNWIYRIAHNQCLNHIKSVKSRKETGMMTEIIPDHKVNIEENLLIQETRSFVFELINKFSAKPREIMVLKFYQGMTYEEISGITGQSVRSVKYILKNALDDLNRKLQEKGFME